MPIKSLKHEGIIDIWSIELLEPNIIASGGYNDISIKIFDW